MQEGQNIGQNTRKLKEEKKKIIESFTIFNKLLRTHQIPLEKILLQAAFKTFNKFMNKSKETKKLYSETIKQFKKPTENQTQCWDITTHRMYNMIIGIQEDSKGNNFDIEGILKAVKVKDKKLQKGNRKDKILQTLNYLPTSLLN